MIDFLEEALDDIERQMLDMDAYYDGVRALVKRVAQELEAGRMKCCPECREQEAAEGFVCWRCENWGVVEADD